MNLEIVLNFRGFFFWGGLYFETCQNQKLSKKKNKIIITRVHIRGFYMLTEWSGGHKIITDSIGWDRNSNLHNAGWHDHLLFIFRQTSSCDVKKSRV